MNPGGLCRATALGPADSQSAEPLFPVWPTPGTAHSSSITETQLGQFTSAHRHPCPRWEKRETILVTTRILKWRPSQVRSAIVQLSWPVAARGACSLLKLEIFKIPI
uniref:Uncharacterized protein n=1 Tax=Theropithecus gelada TaxID=9565 RepID=A0A8D2GLI8_THEGE